MPTVVTKDIGAAGVYQPEGALTGVGPDPAGARRATWCCRRRTRVGGPIGGLGSRTVTGGAVSADGRVVALRTYTDAWLFAVPTAPDGDVAAALRGTPGAGAAARRAPGRGAGVHRGRHAALGLGDARRRVGQLRAVPGAAALAGAAAPATPSAPRPVADPSGHRAAAGLAHGRLGAGAVVVSRSLGAMAAAIGASARARRPMTVSRRRRFRRMGRHTAGRRTRVGSTTTGRSGCPSSRDTRTPLPGTTRSSSAPSWRA